MNENNIGNGYYGIKLHDSSNHNSISANSIAKNEWGIHLTNSINNTIYENNIAENNWGIELQYSSNNSITGNNVTANMAHGIWLGRSPNNHISRNNITNNSDGVGLYESSNNTFHHNNFIDNTQQTYFLTSGYANFWDDGYPSGGNYWSDYTGVDNHSGPHQNETGSDGIGDTPYVIDENNQDNYPFMKPCPWSSHDIGITGITTSTTVVGQGFSLNISITIFNYGDDTETFNVTVYANETTITLLNGENYTTVALASGESASVVITWNTAGFAIGNYNMTVCTTPVSGETDTTDNNLTDGWILVTIPGDVDGDLENGHYDVDLFDAVKLLACYGAKEGEPNFDPNCDIDDNGQVFLFDAVILLSRYGQKYP
jgi:parallel beta-helix repeat protein